MLDLINRYCHGYVVLPAIVELNENNFFDLTLYKEPFSLDLICQQRKINKGYLSVVFRSMLAMGLVKYSKGSGLWQLCDQGEVSRIPTDLPRMLELASGRCLEDASLSPLIINWIDQAVDHWGFGEHFLADFIEGLLIIPLLIELKANGYFCPKKNELDLTRFSAEMAAALKKLFVAKGWGEEKISSVSVAASGAYLIDRLMNAGTVMSYAPMLSQMDALLYGDSDSVFTRDEVTGHENHIERTLNVVASGFQHEKYFKDIEKTILSIFDTQDFSAQPNYIADMGCGDGSLLKKVYEIIAEKSARGKVLGQFPLTLIGVDYNDKALVATAETLEGFPFITIHGDIGDPAQLEIDLKSQVPDVADILHVRSFLDHDRPFIAPTNFEACENKKDVDWQVLSVGSGGDLVEPAVAIQGLVEHFSRWAQLQSKHGMLVLEVHSVPTGIAGEYMDECESLHFDAYHSFSRQHLVNAEHFSIAASEAGWFPDLAYSRFYSKVLPFKRITLNMLQKRNYTIRYACRADLPALANLNNVVTKASDETLTNEVVADLVATYPQGQYVLIKGQELVAACFTLRGTPSYSRVAAQTLANEESTDEDIYILGMSFDKSASLACKEMLEFVSYNSQLKSGVETVEGQNEIQYAIGSLIESTKDDFPSLLAGLSSYEQSYPSNAAQNTINAELAIAMFAGRRLVQWMQSQGLMLRANQHYTFASLITDLNVQEKYHRLFRALLNMLERQHVLTFDNDSIVTQEAIDGFALQDFDREALEFEQHITLNYPGITAFWHLTKRCLSSYGQILSGSIASNDVVFEDGSMELFAKIFKGNPVADYYNELLAESIVAMLLAKRANGDQSEFRVLEVGAGTGGATEFVLRKLGEHSHNVSFYYTDISSTFTRYGRDRFAQTYPWVRFQKLDVGKDPELQGFDANSFDAVFAFNVLHDTAVIHQTLGWINRLLNVGGVLLMNEYTRVKDMLLFSGGLLHGLWIYKDPEYRIEHSCFLSVEQWKKIAVATGYNDFAAFGDPHLADVNNSWQSVMLCQKTDEVDMSVIEQLSNSNTVLPESRGVHSNEAAKTAVNQFSVSAVGGQQYSTTLQKVSAAIAKVKEDVPAGAIQPDSPIMELGLDSLELVELKSLLNKAFKLTLSTSEFFTHTTPGKIARHICVLKGAEKPNEVQTSNESSSVVQKAELVDQLKEILSRLEKENLDQNIDADRSFMEMGLDSIELVELRSLVNKAFRLKLNTTIFFKFTNINALAEHLLELISASTGPNGLPPKGPSAAPRPRNVSQRVNASQPTNTSQPSQKSNTAPSHNNSEFSSSPTQEQYAQKSSVRDEDIAIIGLALHFPGEINSREKLWDLLSNGGSAIRPMPESRWEWPDSVDIDGQKSYLKQAGFASDIELFDAEFFNISRREAELMDPQQRMVMQLAWQTIEDAGYKASSLRGSNTGVYIGACHFDYSELAKHSDYRNQTYVATGTNSSLLANRVSYFFDFEGPSMMIDTACSSSLVAVHDAVGAIRRGDCDQALVGGVNLICTPTNTLVYDRVNILSKDNRCATFDKNANGFVRGEGGAVFMLKSLKQAVADGDSISGVIKGAAVNHGGKATSLTAPNPNAQAKLIVKALKDADVRAQSISYIEAHGTGTALGDPVEVMGLKQAFGTESNSAKCGLGTVKSNIGHLEGAAGVAGIMKVLVSLSNKLLPASLHYKDLNPEISFSDSPFYVVDSLRPWSVSSAGVRRAGVSSFGFGGANGHVILEEYEQKTLSANARGDVSGPQLLLFSAKNAESLTRYLKEFRSYIGTTNDGLADIAYSLAHTRDAMSCRLALLVDDKAHVSHLLDCFLENQVDSNIHYRHVEVEENSLSNIFQGDSGQQLLRSAMAEQSLDLIAQAWISGVNADFSSLYDNRNAQRVRLPVYQFSGEKYWLYPSNPQVTSNKKQSGKAFTLERTNGVNQSNKNEQVLTAKLRSSHPVFAQHVIDGAIVCPGVVAVEMVLASLRQVWPDISFTLHNMVWRKPIILDDQEQELCIQLTSDSAGGLACFIRDTQGSGDGIYCQVNAAQATTLFSDVDANISGLQERLSPSVTSEADVAQFYARFRQLAIHHGPYYQRIKKIWGHENEMLAQIVLDESHLESEFSLHPAIADSAFQAISGLVSQQRQTALLPFSVDTIRVFSEPSSDVYAHAVKAMNGLYDVSIFHKNGQKYAVLKGLNFRPYTPSGNDDDSQDYMLKPTWRQSQDSEVSEAETGRSIVFLSENSSVLENSPLGSHDTYIARASADRSRASADRSMAAGDYVDFNSRQSVAAFLKGIRPFDRVYFCSTPGDESSQHKCLNLLQALTDVVSSAQAFDVVIATFDSQHVVDSDVINTHAAGLIGLVQCFSKEYARWRVGIVDFSSSELMQENVNVEGVKYLQRALSHSKQLTAYRAGQVYTQDLVNIDDISAPHSSFRQGGVYLIVGGAGALGLKLSRYLIEQYDATCIWLGRRSITDEVKANQRSLGELGHEPYYIQADVTDAVQMKAALDEAKSRFAAIHGVLHSAAVLDDKAFTSMDKDSFQRVYDVKEKGSQVLGELLRNEDLDFLCFFSSLRSFFPEAGQSNYAAGCTFQDAYAASLRSQVEFPVHIVNWGYWHGDGLASNYEEKLLEQGLRPLAVEKAMISLESALFHGVQHALVFRAQKSYVNGTETKPVAKLEVGLSSNVVQSAPEKNIKSPDLKNIAEDFLVNLVSESLKLPKERVFLNKAFEEYGIDSMMIIDLTEILEKDFGKLPSSMFFEHRNIKQLAGYFAESHGKLLSELNPVKEQDAGLTEQNVDLIKQATTLNDKTLIESVISPSFNATLGQTQQSESINPEFSTSNQLSENAINSNDIAIIGVGGRYPEAPNLDIFWNNLKTGKDCITEIPESRWNFKELYEQGKIDSKWGGFIKDADKFDPLFFNISPREAEKIDPQERLFLQTVWETMEDAGYTRARMNEGSTHQYGSGVGVYVGVMYEEYKFLGVENSAAGDVVSLSAHPSSIANRVSYHCDFRGPSMAVDTMCSSSLTAIHLACKSLRDGECEYAFAGGVNLNLHPDKYIYLAQGKFSSSDGRCRSFGEGGDGFVPSEGVGAVLLKPLNKAIEDGDQIYAVIKGSSINHGGKTNGYTVPDPTAQGELIQKAMQNAAVSARDFSYIETHGTGTPLGDPVELAGLSKAIKGSERDSICAIGSVKSNIGHCESAAGIAAVTKVLLQLKHKQLVPSIHSDSLNKNIDFDASVFKVQRNLEEWPQFNGAPRVAGISGFGAGGSNAHVIMQEYVASDTTMTKSDPSSVSDETVAIVLSAKNEERLRSYAENLQNFLDKTLTNKVKLTDIAYTLQIGREPLNARLVLLVNSTEQLVSGLQRFINGDKNTQSSYFDLIANVVEAQEQFELNQNATQSITRALQNGQLELLAEHWVRGAFIDWSTLKLAANIQANVISLPTYPFAQKRYWVDSVTPAVLVNNSSQTSIAEAKLHPLVHENTSTIGHQSFSSIFSGKEFFFVDHRVGDRNIMPATAFLEMARVVCKHSIKQQNEFIIEDILFVAPLEASETGEASVKITVESCAINENNFEYTIFSDYQDNRQILHSTGCFVSIDSSKYPSVPVIDVENIKRRCPNHIAGDAIYSQFRENNFHYGTSFAVLREVAYNQTEAFSTIEFPSNGTALDSSYVIHPSIMDGALQSLIGVLNSDSENNQFPLYVPFSISSIRVFHALPARVYVYAVRDQSNKEQSDEFIRFNIQLVDEDSRVLLDAKEVVYRKMKKSLSEEDMNSSSLLKVSSASVSTDLQNQRNGVESKLHSIAADILQLDVEELHLSEELKNYGFDSVTFTEFANIISSELGVEVKPTIFFDYHTLAALADYFLEEHANEIPQYSAEVNSQDNVHVEDSSLAEESSSIEQNAVVEEPLTAINDSFTETQDEDPIVIVGMSGVMPQSDDVHEFWDHLANGENLVTEVPGSRWKWSEYYGDAINDPTKTNSKWGGFIRDVDKFDPAFFNMSPTEAEVMDPQQRLFLQEVWKCIEDAGYAPSSLNGRKVAVYVGMQFQEYQSMMFQHSDKFSAHMATGNAHSILPNRVSYLLNLTGPSEAIDTACSSSLVAIHRAVQSIKLGEAEVAIAGGVSLALSPETYVLTSQMGAYSPNGRCKTFDKDADGYVKGEGVGAVFLKRLSRAEADGNHIYGVIKSSVLNHGGKSQSLTAPSSASQANLLIDAYSKAKIDPRTLSYIETHGTGTPLGDPIEIKGLKTAFKALYEKHNIESPVKTHIGLGAVKTNTGHLEPAAGMAGLFKVLMSMKHNTLPGNANFDELNPYIELQGSPFYIQKENTPWLNQRNNKGETLPRRAGLSSFGFGGVNAHLVLEDMPKKARISVPASNLVFDKHAIVLSAKTELSLRQSVQKLHRFIMDSDDSLDLSSLAFTLQTGRDAMHIRLAVLIKTKQELLFELDGQKDTLHSTQSARFVTLKAHKIGSKVTPSHAPQNVETIVEQWLSGNAPDWSQLYAKPYPVRMSLPTYSFQKNRYWFCDEIDSDVSDSQKTERSQPANKVKELSSSVKSTSINIDRDMVYMTPTWLEDKSFNEAQKSIPLSISKLLVFSDDEIFIKSLNENRNDLTLVQVSRGEKFVALNNNVACLPQQSSKKHLEQLFSDLVRASVLPQVIIVDLPNIAWNTKSENKTDLHQPLQDAISLSQALISIKAKGTSIIYLNSDNQPDCQPQNSSFSGFVKTLGLEESGIKGCTVTVAQQSNAGVDGHRLEKTTAVIDSLNGSLQEDVLYSQNKRWLNAEVLVPTNDASSSGQPKGGLKDDGVYLLTGGAGGLGLIFAEHIVSSAKRVKLILMGRTRPSNETLAKINSIDTQSEVHFLPGDVTLLADVQQVVNEISTRFGTLNGVVHCAGVLRDKLIRNYDEQSASTVLAPKLEGTHNLDQATQHISLDFMLYCSSLAGLKGNVGQSVYAYANLYMDGFAQLRNSWVDQGLRHGRTVSINWPLWMDGGMTVDEHTIRAIEQRLGLLPLSKEEGLLAFDYGIGTIGINNYYPKAYRPSSVVEDEQLTETSTAVSSRYEKEEIKPSSAASNVEKQNFNASENRVDSKQLIACTSDYLGKLFEQELHAPIDIDAPFEESGVDSFLSIKVINKLEKEFGKLKKTLLFEYFTIQTLSQYLVESQSEKLLELFPQAVIKTPTITNDVVDLVSPAHDMKIETDVKSSGSGVSYDKVVSMLAGIFSDVAKLEISPADRFEEVGIDSFLSIKAVRELETIFGKLSKTLLFEHFTIEKLAHYFIESHQETLQQRFGNESVNDVEVEAADEPVIASVVLKSAPSVLTQSELSGDINLANIISNILEHHGNEGTVARATPLVAPIIFLGSNNRAFFRMSHRDNMMLVWSYAGPEDDYLNLVEELSTYANDSNSELNILSTRWLQTVGDVEFTSTPFGALQQITDVADFKLSGKKMRRLRYSVNKFVSAGECETREYTIGDDKSVDQSIIAIIDEWCKSKPQVNPSVSVVRDSVKSGHLESVHRVFLTYFNDVLVNVILITRMIDGYLMDMEFYPKDMPYGGLEFAITKMISLLKEEDGCRMFSLGGTYGPEIETSSNADNDVREILEQIRATNDFSQGNLQFKNKFRTLNSAIYLCKPVGGDVSNVLDILMLIADPEASNDSNPAISATSSSDSVNHPSQETVSTIAEMVPGDIDNDSRINKLEEGGYNPALIASEFIACDLLTDSWLQLKTDYVADRYQQLIEKSVESNLSVYSLLSEMFGFEHIHAVQSGRHAESVLCESWPQNKTHIVQNLLFPTWIFTQIEHGFNPVELPNVSVFSSENKATFKGGMDIHGTQTYLSEHAENIGMLCVELANNAAGGYPISMPELEQLSDIAKTNDIPLVLDITRILDNAVCIQRSDNTYQNKSIWEITKKICSLADCVTGSLGKNFCVPFGGIVATRDASLFEKVVACSLSKDSNLTDEQSTILAPCLQDRAFIERNVSARVDGVTSLWSTLHAAGVPVMTTPGAHCVLIDVSQIPAFSAHSEAQSEFIAWLYKSTGVRAGIHNAGMQKNTILNNMVRLVVPVGLTQSRLDIFSKRIANAFSPDLDPLALVVSQKSNESFGHMASRFELAERVAEVACSCDETSMESVDLDAKVDTSNEQTVHEEDIREEDIAIVGLAGRYPMANNIDEFWDNLSQGRDCVSDIPDERLDLRFQSRSDEPLWGGYVGDVDKFDAAFFKVPANEAKNIDPQERLFLEVAWQALEDSGYYPESLIDTLGSNNIGVYSGVVWSQYHMLALDNNYASQLSTQFGVSNRVSYFMNFSGPSLTLNSACTSSLNALKLACDAIASKQIKAAIVGGVNLDIHPSKQDALKGSDILSSSGRCRSFGKGADGYVTGEGVGAVVLKPLSQALKDKDNIYTIIKSVVSNHTGSSSGYGVPNPHAQTAVIDQAMKKSGVQSDSISFIEAHGTGTELGDSLEILALNNSLKNAQVSADKSCAIASVKSNIGHLEAAAGIASVTKVALQFRHKKLVPSLHSTQTGEFIDFENSVLKVQQELENWAPQGNEDEPLRAGLNAFADGGSNVHMVFEEYRAKTQQSKSQVQEHVIPLSANSQTSLNEFITRLIAFLRGSDDVDLYSIAYTLQVGRKPMPIRAAFRANSIDEFISKLEAYNESGESFDDALKVSPNENQDDIVENYLLSGDAEKVVDQWKKGATINWALLYEKDQPHRVSLPTYSFAKDVHWLGSDVKADEPTIRSIDYIQPSVGTEEQLAVIWEQVLEIEPASVGATDSFFEIGGDSLSGQSVISKVREEFQRELPITSLFTHSTVRDLAQVIDDLPKSDVQTTTIQSIGSVDYTPQSYAQQSLWLIDQINGADANYNIGISIILSGVLDVKALHNCFSQLVQRHEIFRTSFSFVSGVPSQKIIELPEFSLPLIETKESQVADLVSSHFKEIFSLDEAPLISAKLFRVASDRHTLSINMHHIISDAWSLGLMFSEINNIYCDLPYEPAHSLHYKDYAAWQQNLLSPNGKSSQWQETMLDYWYRSLDGANYHLPLPYDKVDTKTINSEVGNENRLLNSTSTLALKDLSNRNGVTLFSTLFSGLSLLMSRQCECDDMVLGTVVAGRSSIETQTMIGCFMNFLALRIKVDESLTLKQFIGATSGTILEGLRHQECPFEKVVERINPKTRAARSPLYNVSLRLQNMHIEELNLPELCVEDTSVVMGGAQLDLMFEAIETSSGLELNIQYDQSLFEKQTIDGLLASFEDILEQLPLSEDVQIKKIIEHKTVVEPQEITESKDVAELKDIVVQESSELKLVICSSFTAEPLADSLSYLAEKIDCPLTLEFAPYNQTLQQLLDPTSLVSSNVTGVNLFLVRMEDWCTNGSIEGVQEKISEFTQMLSQSASNYSRPYIIQFCPVSQNAEDGLNGLSKQFESDLIELSKTITNIYVLTLAELNNLYPVTNAYNASIDLEGHVPFTPEAYTAMGALALRKVHSITRKQHKVIVLDCDNTLWRGVCGELGANGVEISPAYTKIQTLMQQQKHAGVLLCLCSKNNPEAVNEVFSTNAAMVLSMDDIVSSRINWKAKSDNIMSLAQELNLGLDSFVFIDDDAVQCAEVRSRCPAVQTIELPKNEDEIKHFIDHVWALDLARTDVNSVDRTSFYKQNQQRHNVKEQTLNLDDFIASLELKVEFNELSSDFIDRAAELTLRTNQFNCGGKRYSESELREHLNNDKVNGFVVDVSDRYGDYGLVGLCLFEETDSTLVVDTFLLSCRAMARGIEYKMVSHLGELAKKNNLSDIRIEFQASEKNEPALSFLTLLGLTDKSESLLLSSQTASDVSYRTHSTAEKVSKQGQVKLDNQSLYSVTDYQHIATEVCRAQNILEQITNANITKNESADFSPARDNVEIKLSEVWAKVLKLDRVGLHDDFFNIGGNSLLAVSLVTEIHDFWGVKLRIKDLFNSSTLLSLSELLKTTLNVEPVEKKNSQKVIRRRRSVINEEATYEL